MLRNALVLGFLLIMSVVAIKPSTEVSLTRKLYQTHLDREEKKCFKELFALLNIDRSAWNKEMQFLESWAIKGVYYESVGPVSSSMRTMVKELVALIQVAFLSRGIGRDMLIKAGICHSIDIVNVACEHGFEASTDGFTLYICEELINKNCNTDDEKRALILHELYHVYHRDSLVEFCFHRLYQQRGSKKDSDKNAWHKALQRLAWFQEKRADIYAGLVDKKYTRSLTDLWERPLGSIVYDPYHPPLEQRAAWLRSLQSQL